MGISEFTDRWDNIHVIMNLIKNDVNQEKNSFCLKLKNWRHF